MLARPGETRSDQPRDFGSAQTSTASRVTQRFVLGVLPPPEREAGGRVVHTTRDEPAEGFRPDRVPRAGLGQLPRSRGASPARLRLRRDALSAVGCGLRIVRKRRAPGTGSSSVVPAGRASARYGARDRHFGGERVRNGACSARRSPRATWANARGATAVGDGISGRGEWTSKRNEAQEGAGRPAPATVAGFTRLDDGARPRSRRSRSSHCDGPDPWRQGPGEARRRSGRERQGGKGRGDTSRLSGEDSFEGYEPASRESRGGRGQSAGTPRAETRWTPGSAAGCNKPATRGAEEAVEVVRNHEGGTGLRGWHPRGRSDDWPSSREWTLREHVGGGATGASPGHVARACGRNPERRPRNRPGRSVWLRRGAKVWRFARTVPSGSGRADGERDPRGPARRRARSRRAWGRPTTHSAPRTGNTARIVRCARRHGPRAPREPHGSRGRGTRSRADRSRKALGRLT
jgi:hypothetical protein